MQIDSQNDSGLYAQDVMVLSKMYIRINKVRTKVLASIAF